MQAKVSRKGEVTIVEISGKISYENVDPFREKCLNTFGSDKKVIFNLQGLSFVGSTGITQFVGTIKDLMETNPEGVRLCGVGSEFQKVFAAASDEEKSPQIFSELQQAEYSFIEDDPSKVIRAEGHLPQT